MLYRVENIVRKEKLLVTSNFSFSHNVSRSYTSSVRQNMALCGNGLIDTKEAFLTTCSGKQYFHFITYLWAYPAIFKFLRHIVYRNFTRMIFDNDRVKERANSNNLYLRINSSLCSCICPYSRIWTLNLAENCRRYTQC